MVRTGLSTLQRDVKGRQRESLLGQALLQVRALVHEQRAGRLRLGDQRGRHMLSVELQAYAKTAEMRRIELQFHLAIAGLDRGEQPLADAAGCFQRHYRRQRQVRRVDVAGRPLHGGRRAQRIVERRAEGRRRAERLARLRRRHRAKATGCPPTAGASASAGARRTGARPAPSCSWPSRRPRVAAPSRRTGARRSAHAARTCPPSEVMPRPRACSDSPGSPGRPVRGSTGSGTAASAATVGEGLAGSGPAGTRRPGSGSGATPVSARGRSAPGPGSRRGSPSPARAFAIADRGVSGFAAGGGARCGQATARAARVSGVPSVVADAAGAVPVAGRPATGVAGGGSAAAAGAGAPGGPSEPRSPARAQAPVVRVEDRPRCGRRGRCRSGRG